MAFIIEDIYVHFLINMCFGMCIYGGRVPRSISSRGSCMRSFCCCPGAGAAVSATKQVGPPVAGLALVCVPEEETLLLPQQGGPLLLLYQQQLQQCCGRSRLLLQLLHRAGWATIPIWMEQVRVARPLLIPSPSGTFYLASVGEIQRRSLCRVKHRQIQ